MKKNFIVVVSFLNLLVYSLTKNETYTTAYYKTGELKTENFYNNFHRKIESQFEYYKTGELKLKLSYDYSGDKSILRKRQQYDKKGNKKTIVYDRDGSILSISKNGKKVFLSNGKDAVIKKWFKNKVTNYNEDGSIRIKNFSLEQKYKNNKIVLKYEYFKNGMSKKTSLINNGKNRVIRKFNIEGFEKSRSLFNSKGEITNQLKYKTDFKLSGGIHLSTYNDKKELVVLEKFNNKYKIKEKSFYTKKKEDDFNSFFFSWLFSKVKKKIYKNKIIKKIVYQYHKNGHKKKESIYKENKILFKENYYRKNSILEKIVYYQKNGKVDKEKYYYQNGKSKKDIFYDPYEGCIFDKRYFRDGRYNKMLHYH